MPLSLQSLKCTSQLTHIGALWCLVKHVHVCNVRIPNYVLQDPAVRSLQEQLDAALGEIAKMKAASVSTATPSPASRLSGVPSSAATTPTTASKKSPDTVSGLVEIAWYNCFSIKSLTKEVYGVCAGFYSAALIDHQRIIQWQLNAYTCVDVYVLAGPVICAQDAPHDGDKDPSSEDESAKALKRYKLVDARLRRLCEKKPSGKLNVPESIHRAWLAGGTQRDELRVLLEKLELDKDWEQMFMATPCWCRLKVKHVKQIDKKITTAWKLPRYHLACMVPIYIYINICHPYCYPYLQWQEQFVHQMVKIIEKKHTESQEVLKGWFTPDQMKTKLLWTTFLGCKQMDENPLYIFIQFIYIHMLRLFMWKSHSCALKDKPRLHCRQYIKDAIAYCNKHGLVKTLWLHWLVCVCNSEICTEDTIYIHDWFRNDCDWGRTNILQRSASTLLSMEIRSRPREAPRRLRRKPLLRMRPVHIFLTHAI